MEIIPKLTEKTPFWQDIALLAAAVLFLASIGFYLIFNSFAKKSEIAFAGLERTLTEKKTANEISLEKEVLDSKKMIEDFSVLLASHVYPEKFFGFFEKIVHPEIWFSKFNLDSEEKEVKLSGLAENFADLQAQLLLLEESSDISGFNLENIFINKEGKIDFVAEFNFDGNLLKLKK